MGMDELHYLLGNSCNLDCDFCFWEKRVEPATFNSAKHIIDEIKGVGIKKITISGGEPTCAPIFLKALKYAKENGIEVILHTNGLKIEKELARKIAPLITRVSLTLDGSNEEVAIKIQK